LRCLMDENYQIFSYLDLLPENNNFN